MTSSRELGEITRPLKFRKVMGKFFMGISRLPLWMSLDRFWGRKIKNMRDLQAALDLAQEREFSPIRLYSSASEFLNAKELRSVAEVEQYNNHLLTSWMAIESDIPLNAAQSFYQLTYRSLKRAGIDPIIVSTGDRSIHFWFKFDYPRYLPPRLQKFRGTKKRYSIREELWLDYQARRRFLHFHLYDSEVPLRYVDLRVALDPLRVLPVTGTWNQYSRKWVTRLEPEYLYCDPADILYKCTLSPGDTDAHQVADSVAYHNVQRQIVEFK